MTDSTTITTYAALLTAALAGSLHCIGMCGPILLAFTGAMKPTSTGDAAAPKPGRLALTFLWYHAGRIWTYAMLGLFAGYVGCCIRHSSALASWQRAVGITTGIIVAIVGLVLVGAIPGVRVDHAGACGLKRLWNAPLLRSLLRTQAVSARLLLGAIMGLLPCGLVYAMLTICATLPSPMHAALGMVIFGIGTVPSLTAVLISSHLIPPGWRRYSTRIAGVMVIGAGLWMAMRSTLDLCGHG
jgi:sulfite exporter TauE/SafE